MSRATILFYKDNFVYPIFKKVFGAKGLSKTEFTAFLFSKAKKIILTVFLLSKELIPLKS